MYSILVVALLLFVAILTPITQSSSILNINNKIEPPKINGYDGEDFGIHNAVAEWGEDGEGYTIVPSWSVPAMIVAALSVAKIMKYENKEVVSSIGKLFRIDR